METEISPTGSPGSQENTDAPSTNNKSPASDENDEDQTSLGQAPSENVQSSEAVDEPGNAEEGEVAWNKDLGDNTPEKDKNDATRSSSQTAESPSQSEVTSPAKDEADSSAAVEDAATATDGATTSMDGIEDRQSVVSTATTGTKPDDSEAPSDYGDADLERLLGEPVDLEVLAKNAEDGESEDDFEMADDDPQADTPKSRQLLSRLKKKPGRFSDSFEGELPSKGRRSGGKIVGTKIPQTLKINPMWTEPLRNGWKREIVLRGTYEAFDPTGKVKGRPADVYYFAPNGKKLRSKVEVEKHLDMIGSTFTVENFTFMKERIFEPPVEYIRTAGGRRGGGTPKKHVKSTPKMARKDSADSLGSPKISKVKTDQKDAALENNTDNKAMIVKLPNTGDNTTTVVMMSGATASGGGVRRAVAKKHTGKRGRSSMNGAPTSVKKQKITQEFGMIKHESYKNDGQKLCGLDCPGRQGVPPSLHCEVCMCMFHPDCVKFFLNPQSHGFVCKACQGSESGHDQNKNTNGRPIVSPNFRPPPLTAGQVPPGIVKVVGSLNHGLSGIEGVRISNTTSIGQMGMLVNSSPLSAPQAVAPPLDAIHVSLPNMNPNQITGQLLTLPAGIAQKLSLNENLTLKVHGKTFIVPPTCFISTPDGIKVLLPPGSLPEKSVHGPSKPLDVHMDSQQAGLQMISVNEPNMRNGSRESPVSQKAKPSDIVLPAVSHQPGQRSRRRFRDGINPSLCFVKKLHSGYDCMLHIFQYLGVPDLLRASRVCQAWNGVAQQNCLWQNVKLKGALITDWIAAAKFFECHRSKKLDMKDMGLSADKNKTWHQFVSALAFLKGLRQLEFGKCPASILHSVAENLLALECVTAEFITDSMSEPQMWTTNAKLDIGKFSKVSSLKQLKLRGICGLLAPVFSFSGGLSELGVLTKITNLSLTTLREVPAEEFTFLGSLEKLESLEIGDCNLWNKEMFDGLGKMTQLRTLRLESGGAIPDVGLGDALKNKNRLETLELVKWVIADNLATDLHSLKQLRSLTLWPYTNKDSQVAEVNSNTMKAVSNMPFLKSFEWAIIMSSSRDSPVETPVSESLSISDCIPFLDKEEQTDEVGQLPVSTKFVSINSMLNTLRSHLPDTKIRVFKVPSVTHQS